LSKKASLCIFAPLLIPARKKRPSASVKPLRRGVFFMILTGFTAEKAYENYNAPDFPTRKNLQAFLWLTAG